MLGLALILVLGVVAQWVAWRARLPAILVLLLTGFLVGPFVQWLSMFAWWPEHWPQRFLGPDALLGELLIPLVSLSVAVILFEGGLTLDMRELSRGGAGRVITRLVSAGAVTSWALTTLAARWIFGMEWGVALLLGAILVVTGPTVIGPLLAYIRPKGQTGSILKWEGIVIDPIGAMLAVLVYEAIGTDAVAGRAAVIAWVVVRTVVVGLVLGGLGGLGLIYILRRRLVPDQLHNPVMLMAVIALFAISNLFQSESGLLTVVIMGIVLANQRTVSITHVAEFKEHLTNLLIASLFIVLSARVTLDQLDNLGWRSVAFILLLIIVVRPLAVVVSTVASPLNWRERVFLAWMAPRGIVAAAVASIFALRLDETMPAAGMILPLTLAVIIGTVVVYGLTARALALRLGLAKPGRHGFVIAGANPLARAIAKALQDSGVEVLLVDLNYDNVQAARLEGLPAMYRSILDEPVRDRVSVSSIGRLLALTPNDDVNTLAAVRFARSFGPSNVYQLAAARPAGREREKATQEIRGRVLFGDGWTYPRLLERLEQGATIRRTRLTREYTFQMLRGDPSNPQPLLPLFLIGEADEVSIFTPGDTPTPRAGQTVISLADSAPASPAPQRAEAPAGTDDPRPGPMAQPAPIPVPDAPGMPQG
jgi:NhaP-type Na+/H+ or K+/H+ antiporter